MWFTKNKTAKAASTGDGASGQAASSERNRIAFIVLGFGTTGTDFLRWLIERDPSIAKVALAIDGEAEPDGEESPWRISTGTVRDYRKIIDQSGSFPMIAHNPFLLSLKYPEDGGEGAGTSRLVGGSMKYPAIRSQFVHRVSMAIDEATKAVEGGVSQFNVFCVTSSCGGTGSGVSIEALLDAWRCVRRMLPETPPTIILHEVNPTCFWNQVKDEGLREKLLVCAGSFYREIAYAQVPHNLAALCKAMDMPTPRGPLVSELVSYHQTSSGGQSIGKSERFARIYANVAAANNGAIAHARNRDGCNQAMLLGGVHADGAERIVTSAVSAVATVKSGHISAQFATVFTAAQLEALVAAASEQAVGVLFERARELLGLDIWKQKVLRSFQSLEEKSATNSVVEKAGHLRGAEAGQVLRDAQKKFDYHNGQAMEGKQAKILRHFESVVIPGLVAKVTAELTTTAKSVNMVASAFLDLSKHIHALWQDEDRLVKATAQEAQKASTDHGERLKGLEKRRLFGSGRKQATGAALAMVEAQNRAIHVAFHETWADCLVSLERAVTRRSESLTALSSGVRERLGIIKDAARSINRTLETDPTLVVSPDEVKSLPQKLLAALKASGQEIPSLELKKILEVGEGGLDTLLENHGEKLRSVLLSWLDADVPGVMAFSEKVGLKWKLASWLEHSLSLARSTPLDVASLVRETIVVAAAGDELAAARRFIGQRATQGHSSSDLESIASADARTISVAKIVSNMPIQALATWEECERALKKFPAPRLGAHVYNVVCSSPHLAPAFGGTLDEMEGETTKQLKQGERSIANGTVSAGSDSFGR